MILSHDYKFFFFHIPRTGGSSFAYSLREILGNGRKFKGSAYEKFTDQGRYHRNNVVHDAYLDNLEVVNQYPDYTKIAFVRNPWERLFSCHCGQLRNFNVTPSAQSFKVFMTEGHTNDIPFYFYPQSHWVCDENGNIAMDFVGRFENWNEDYKHIMDMLSLNIKACDINKSLASKLNYQDFYDDELIAIVEEKDKVIIEKFNYTY